MKAGTERFLDIFFDDMVLLTVSSRSNYIILSHINNYISLIVLQERNLSVAVRIVSQTALQCKSNCA